MSAFHFYYGIFAFSTALTFIYFVCDILIDLHRIYCAYCSTMRIQSLASPPAHGYSCTSSSHHQVSSYSGWNNSVKLVLAAAIIACIPARTASFPSRSVSVQRRHAPLDSIYPGSNPTAFITSTFTAKAFFAVRSPSRSPATTTSTLYSKKKKNNNQDETPFLVALIDTLVDFSKRPFALNSGNSKRNAVSALYPAALLLVAVTQPLSNFLTTLSLFVALVTATRQLIFAPDDDDDEPYDSFEYRKRVSCRNDDDDDDDDDDRGLQVFLTDGFSLAASFASARLLLPPNLEISSSLAPLSVSPGVIIGVLAAAGAAFWQSTSRRGRLESASEDEDDDDDPEQRLLDLWDQRFKRRTREDNER
jgi:hypothetical protein